jgi:hypothetical protein
VVVCVAIELVTCVVVEGEEVTAVVTDGETVTVATGGLAHADSDIAKNPKLNHINLLDIRPLGIALCGIICGYGSECSF